MEQTVCRDIRKPLNVSRTSWLRAMISVGVTQPGVTGMLFSTHQLTISSLQPGKR